MCDLWSLGLKRSCSFLLCPLLLWVRDITKSVLLEQDKRTVGENKDTPAGSSTHCQTRVGPFGTFPLSADTLRTGKVSRVPPSQYSERWKIINCGGGYPLRFEGSLSQAGLYWEQDAIFHKREEKIFYVRKDHSQIRRNKCSWMCYLRFVLKDVSEWWIEDAL